MTESAMLPNQVTGKPAEVDICIQTVIGEHTIVISVECRDHKRRADIQWIEQMKTKHEHLPTNKLVLVSRKGFTRAAVALATHYNIEYLVLEEMDTKSVRALFDDTNSFFARTLTLMPTKVKFQVVAIETFPSEVVRVAPDNTVFHSDGRPISTAMELTEKLLNSEAVITRLLQEATVEHKYFFVKWQNPLAHSIRTPCLQKIEPKLYVPIEAIHIEGTCHVEVSEFPIRQAALGKIKIAWGTGTLWGQDTTVLATEDSKGVKKMSLSFNNQLT
ncbi:MAG: hypothetical protein ACT4QE_25435 [Anaerolineales bacterium]